jgi:hypothetical protein
VYNFILHLQKWLGIGRKEDTPNTNYTEEEKARRKVLVNRLGEIAAELRELRERHDAESARLESEWANKEDRYGKD